ncbi:unnamed protein product [Callosobruchus maculatus]|uniref:SET domain-containing protein n=1 Tax=Callosobruchus maculatus TaxID=64391 RepID=A0A653BPL2_CALMS|nr:unnamed protein product [Callosobruchus maculatus]
MDCLLSYYTDKFTSIEGNIFEVFSKFYNLDLSPVDSWLETHFINRIEKDDKTSIQYRKEGNKYYASKDLVKSLEYYTKSICNATVGGREYSLALANRSAVTFEMREYENCLRDIELCLKADYPTALKPKIYFRKAECYLATSQKENFEKCIFEVADLLHNTHTYIDKDKYIEKLNQIRKEKIKSKALDENLIELPTFSEGENENFAYASSKVKISYDKTKGRHVVASKNIQKGEVLFIEKAFIFAPVFKENREFYPFNCKKCTLCIYCNEKCLISSWNECHKWECNGMQASIWYDLGIAFPAFKAVLKGAKSGFRTIKGDHCEDVKKFGDKDDNYPYFNRLVSHIYKTKNAAPYVIMAAVVVSYLKNYTNFFTWFLQQKDCPKTNMIDLVNYIGGLITKHIAQLSSNSTLQDISENEEIYNCYGIDYRTMTRDQRQMACRGLYHFECKCEICVDPTNEMAILDSYLCPNCKGLVPEIPNNSISFCIFCEKGISLKPLRIINNTAQKYLEDEHENQLESLLNCLKLRKDILYEHHKDFEEVYYRIYSFYVETGDAENMFKYFKLWLENEKARKGENSRGIGTKLYEAALAILRCLQNSNPKTCTNLKAFLENVEHMIREAKMLVRFYILDIGGSLLHYIMSKENSTLKTISDRLGVTDSTTIKKAEEFLRSLQTKCSSLKVLNDSAKSALCLHLAASFLRNGFDKDAAIKLSGLKKSLYQNNLHTIEKILGLDKQLTVSALSVQLGCTEIKELAEEILDKYRAYDTKIKDFDHPQYVSAATYIACKQKSVKVHKDQFITASRLKPRQWKELVLEFEKFAKSLGLGSLRKNKKELTDPVEDITNEIEKVTMKKKTENEVEDYEVWRKRILDEAYAALGMKNPES